VEEAWEAAVSAYELVLTRRRPYDLRHAAVSTWLNVGVPATQVAEWADHDVAVLLQIYAKCLAGQEELARGSTQPSGALSRPTGIGARIERGHP
jgi:integrase